MIPEADILYQGIAAGKREARLPQPKCIACKSLLAEGERGMCADCKIDRDLKGQVTGAYTPSDVACREGHHERCDGRYARVYHCGCLCHTEAA